MFRSTLILLTFFQILLIFRPASAQYICDYYQSRDNAPEEVQWVFDRNDKITVQSCYYPESAGITNDFPFFWDGKNRYKLRTEPKFISNGLCHYKESNIDVEEKKTGKRLNLDRVMPAEKESDCSLIDQDIFIQIENVSPGVFFILYNFWKDVLKNNWNSAYLSNIGKDISRKYLNEAIDEIINNKEVELSYIGYSDGTIGKERSYLISFAANRTRYYYFSVDIDGANVVVLRVGMYEFD